MDRHSGQQLDRCSISRLCSIILSAIVLSEVQYPSWATIRRHKIYRLQSRSNNGYDVHHSITKALGCAPWYRIIQRVSSSHRACLLFGSVAEHYLLMNVQFHSLSGFSASSSVIGCFTGGDVPVPTQLVVYPWSIALGKATHSVLLSPGITGSTSDCSPSYVIPSVHARFKALKERLEVRYTRGNKAETLLHLGAHNDDPKVVCKVCRILILLEIDESQNGGWYDPNFHLALLL